MESIDWGLVNWSRAQFALTAMYHWLFVPLTLGITFIIAIMETIYVKTGDETTVGLLASVFAVSVGVLASLKVLKKKKKSDKI